MDVKPVKTVQTVTTVTTVKTVKTVGVGVQLKHIDPPLRTGGSTNHLPISARTTSSNPIPSTSSRISPISRPLTSETLRDRIHLLRPTSLALNPRQEMPVFDVPPTPIPLSPLPRIQHFAER